MSIILNGNKYEIPNLTTISYLDQVERKVGNKVRIQPAFGPVIHCTPRTTWIRGIVVHTNRGMEPGRIIPGSKDMERDIALARYQASSTRKAGWDYTVDTDATVAVSNDPWDHYTWHAGPVNLYTTGIEMVQETNKPWNLYEAGLDGTVLLIDYLTARLGIQRQIMCWDSSNNTFEKGVIPGRLQSPLDRRPGKKAPTGGDVVGIYGHRNITTNKGSGDPGNAIFERLQIAGYELFDIRNKQDLEVWTERQKALGMPSGLCNGIPGPETRRALGLCGKDYGMWVSRPIDDLLKEQDAANGYPDSHKNLFKIPGENL